MSNVFARPCPLRLLGALFLFITSLAQAAKPTTTPPPAPPAHHSPEYYYTVELDPRYQFAGTGALTEEDAAKANCYRFIYNNEGKLAAIEYRRVGQLTPDPYFLGVARIDFEYSPGIERRWFRDPQGQALRDIEGVYGEELKLNAAGYPTDITNLDESGGSARNNIGVIHYARALDGFNRVISLKRIGLLGTAITDSDGFYETRTTYDLQDHVVERGNYDASGALLNNDDGVAQIRNTYTLYPDSTQVIESYFDASSLPAEEKSDSVHQLQRTYDKRGFLLDEAYFDATGAPTVTTDDGVHERRYVYDNRGNEVSEEFFDINGHPADRKGPNGSDYAKLIYKYDDQNRVIEKAFFGDDGTPQVNAAVGAAMIRQEYNERGELIRRQFFDGLGHPKAHTQFGVPAIRIKVEGDTTIITLRDDSDRPAKHPVKGFYAMSYKTATDTPMSPTNLYFDRHARLMSTLRVDIINPHLHALATTPIMLWSARLGTAAAGLGSLLACWLALKKASYTRRRKVYVPTPLQRFFGWLSVLAILEGSLRFFITVYWWFVNYGNGHMSHTIYFLEAFFLLFMLYRFNRQRHTMRVLNIMRDDVHRLVKDYFTKAGLKPEWVEYRNRYVTPPLDIRVNYFQQKFHAYLGFTERGNKGHEFARDAAAYIRAQAGGILGPNRTKMVALYYPSVALCYLLLAGTAFYTLFQLIKGY